jgi:hypothetical protein
VQLYSPGRNHDPAGEGIVDSSIDQTIRNLRRISEAMRARGLNTEYCDSRELIKTDDQGVARPLAAD